jgi:tetratricopeptide (TPR) repeat protein
VTIETALQSANQLLKAGHFAEAEKLYRQVLGVNPKHGGALRGLGFLAYQVGRFDAALALLEQAVALGPATAPLLLQMAMTLRQLRRLRESNAAWDRARLLEPKSAQLLNDWGIFLGQRSEFDSAIAAFERAIQLSPRFTPSYENLALAHELNKDLEKAEAACRRRLAVEPDSADGFNRLGLVLAKAGRLDEAADSFRRAVQIAPDHGDANCNLGRALQKQKKTDEAIAHFNRAIAADPRSAKNLYQLATLYTDLARYSEALELLDRAVALHPDDVEIRADRSHLLLRLGRFAEGWREYEHRWKVKSFPHNRRYTHAPQWTGFSIAGQTLLLHSEQGLGDTIQFVRYAPLAARRGARVLLQCQEELVTLLRGIEGVEQVFGNDQLAPKFDVQCPLMSLPFAFGTTVETIPGQTPYLRADPAQVQRWSERLGACGSRRKIGLVWAGRPQHRGDAQRSIPLEKFAPIFAVKDAVFFALQKGPAAAAAPPPDAEMISLGPDLNDFADTAAVVAQLDLVISVDTAVAHLAGALNKPIWTLVGMTGDSRWLTDRETTPWYPTMRLFRQKSLGDWDPVIARVAAALTEWPG